MKLFYGHISVVFATFLLWFGHIYAWRMYANHSVAYESLQRHNFCDVAELLRLEPSKIGTALSGREVLVGVDEATDPIYFQMDPVTFTPIGGLMFFMHQEMETRGNFSFVYAIIPRTNSDTTSRLAQQLPHVDCISSAWYSDTMLRRLAHIGFMQPVVDASLIMVTVQVNPTVKFDPFQFLLPYDRAVWVTMLSLCVFHALLSWAIEGRLTTKPRNEGENYNYFSATFESFKAISNTGAADSMSHPSSRYLNMGFGFFFLVFGAGYTANLASYLTQQPMSGPLVASPEVANFQRSQVCAQYKSSAYTALSVSSTYNHLQLVTDSVNGVTVGGVLTMLREGMCEAAVLTKIDWITHEMQAGTDPNCEFTVVGDPMLSVGGSFAYWPDTTNNCTSAMGRVLNYLIISMKNDGMLEWILEEYVTTYSTTTCPETVAVDNPATALDTEDMAGVFFIYLVFVGMALVYKLFEYFVLPKEEDQADSATKAVAGDEGTKDYHQISKEQ